jgi:hypothetical protein
MMLDGERRPDAGNSDEAERQWLMRIGSVAAVAGALLAGIGNILHPVTPRNDDQGVASVIAQSDAWTVIHLVILAGVLSMFAGLVGVRSALPKNGLPGALSRLGIHAAVLGTVMGIATLILDGVAAKQLADQWAVAPAAEQGAALRIVTANETMNFALAGMFNATFAGFPFVLMGGAVAASRVFPAWLGWVAVAAGLGSIGAGTVQALTGQPTVASLVLTIIGPTVIALWMLIIGVLLWRRSPG